MKRHWITALALALILSLFYTTLAWALTITVDGNGSEWSSEAELSPADPDDAVDNSSDITNIYFTNDSTSLYFRVDTVSAPSWDPSKLLIIGFDTNSNPSDGCPIGGIIGYDFFVAVNSSSSFDYYDSSCSTVFPPPAGIQASTGSTTEVKIPVSLFSLASCQSGSPCTITFDIIAFAGTVLDGLSSTKSGTIPGPTAIDVTYISAGSANTWMPIIFTLGFITLGLAGLSLTSRKR